MSSKPRDVSDSPISEKIRMIRREELETAGVTMVPFPFLLENSMAIIVNKGKGDDKWALVPQNGTYVSASSFLKFIENFRASKIPSYSILEEQSWRYSSKYTRRDAPTKVSNGHRMALVSGWKAMTIQQLVSKWQKKLGAWVMEKALFPKYKTQPDKEAAEYIVGEPLITAWLPESCEERFRDASQEELLGLIISRHLNFQEETNILPLYRGYNIISPMYIEGERDEGAGKHWRMQFYPSILDLIGELRRQAIEHADESETVIEQGEFMYVLPSVTDVEVAVSGANDTQAGMFYYNVMGTRPSWLVGLNQVPYDEICDVLDKRDKEYH